MDAVELKVLDEGSWFRIAGDAASPLLMVVGVTPMMAEFVPVVNLRTGAVSELPPGTMAEEEHHRADHHRKRGDGLDLDVGTPEEVAEVLREAAQKFNESQGELEAAWQDENAGRVWHAFAAILERAAKSCDKAVAKYV